MSKRREFLKIVAAGSAGAVLGPLFASRGTAYADCGAPGEVLGKLPENILYTKDRQGVWKGKDGGHLPVVEVSEKDGRLVLGVETPHKMSEQHYIVRHTVVNGLGEVLGAQTFHWNDEPVSTHTIDIPKECGAKDIFVMSYCNLHDLWLVQTRLQ